MDLDGPADVLSFEVDEIRPGFSGMSGSPNLDARKLGDSDMRIGEHLDESMLANTLGDVVICPEVAKKQSDGLNHTAHEEMLLLCAHGILHLLGYDHEDAKDKDVMFDLQRKLLVGYLGRRVDDLPN